MCAKIRSRCAPNSYQGGSLVRKDSNLIEIKFLHNRLKISTAHLPMDHQTGLR